jgi:hypothetical protein
MQASPDSREFYVYLIFRPDGRPCYVGKGQGGRWLRHFQKAGNPWLSRIIAKAGGDLPIVKVREHLTESEAFETEVAWIKALGRRKDGGPLINATDGGEGVSGLVFSPEALAKMSKATKFHMQNPERRARMSEAAKARLASPETRARMSEAAKAQWESPEARARMLETSKAMWQDPEARARLSEARKAMWQDPDYQARISEARKALWQDPDYQARISEARKAQLESPETRARISEARKAMWQDPEIRAKILATRAKAAALKKAAKEAAD